MHPGGMFLFIWLIPINTLFFFEWTNDDTDKDKLKDILRKMLKLSGLIV